MADGRRGVGPGAHHPVGRQHQGCRDADGAWRGAEGQPLAPPDFQRAASLAASHFENGEYAFSLPRDSSNDWVKFI
jgi:hypothetical protein